MLGSFLTFLVSRVLVDEHFLKTFFTKMAFPLFNVANEITDIDIEGNLDFWGYLDMGYGPSGGPVKPTWLDLFFIFSNTS